jgi:hypothetical protein
MIARIKHIEITVVHETIHETGLLLHYDPLMRELRLIREKDTSKLYNLNACRVSTITVVRVDNTTSRFYDQLIPEQKEAQEYIQELILTLKKDGRCNANGYVNLSSYTDVNIKYLRLTGVGTPPLQLPIVIPISNYVSKTYEPKPLYLENTTAYYKQGGLGNINNKIKVMVRTSDLPTEKFLAAMTKKAEQVALGNFKSKVEALPEKNIEIINTPLTSEQEEKDMQDFYGSCHGDDYSGCHGMIC